jgi:hypothetical protein
LVRAKDRMSWWHLSLLYSRAEIPVRTALTLPTE